MQAQSCRSRGRGVLPHTGGGGGRCSQTRLHRHRPPPPSSFTANSHAHPHRRTSYMPVTVAVRVDAFAMPADESAPEQLQHVCYRAVWEASVVQEHTKWNLGSGLRARTMIRAKLLRQLNLRCRPVCTVTVAVRRCCRPGLRRYLHSSLLSLIFKL